MKIIKEPQVLIGMLEGGEFVVKLQDQIEKTLGALNAAAGPKGKAKGHVTIKMEFIVEGGVVKITPALTHKEPEEGFGSTTLWVTEEGELSTQHPRQRDMFDGPRGVGQRDHG